MHGALQEKGVHRAFVKKIQIESVIVHRMKCCAAL
jgi:hypothetical protein